MTHNTPIPDIPTWLVAREADVSAQPPVQDTPKPILWVALTNLSRGGAQRIVLDWLEEAVKEGYPVRLAVFHTVDHECPVPDCIEVIRREGPSWKPFVPLLCDMIKASGRLVVYTHLISDPQLEIFWQHGIRTVPTVHNARAGWGNDPSLWQPQHVPFAIGCSEIIAEEVRAHTQVPVLAIRHKPSVLPRCFSVERRLAVRRKYGVADDELLIGMIGTFKEQKNYARAMRVLAQLLPHRKAKLFIAGGWRGDNGNRCHLAVCREGARLGLAGKVILPGFVDVPSVLPAFDAVLNTSDWEGLSIATQEALFAGLPVVASDVGGQREIGHPGLTLVAAAAEGTYVAALKNLPVRRRLESGAPPVTVPSHKLWTLAAVSPPQVGPSGSVLFVTADLCGAGAQRSLVNLACELKGHLDFAVAVTSISTHPYFQEVLERKGVEVFRPTDSKNVLDIAAALLRRLETRPAEVVCFWNVDAKIKLLLARFLPNHRIIDVSPGHNAFISMRDKTARLQMEMAFTERQYYTALDRLVLKFHPRDLPPEVPPETVQVIPNGVPAQRDSGAAPSSPVKRIVVQGRIAASKQLDTILKAMPLIWRTVDCTLDIYGQAEPDAAHLLPELLSLSAPYPDRIFWRGARPDLGCELGQYDCQVTLGVHQGCPNAVLEALAAGVPVVANDSGGTRESVVHGETGILLPEAVTPQMVADAVCRLLDMDTTKLRANARAHAQRFSMLRMRDAYLKLFKESQDVATAA